MDTSMETNERTGTAVYTAAHVNRWLTQLGFGPSDMPALPHKKRSLIVQTPGRSGGAWRVDKCGFDQYRITTL